MVYSPVSCGPYALGGDAQDVAEGGFAGENKTAVLRAIAAGNTFLQHISGRLVWGHIRRAKARQHESRLEKSERQLLAAELQRWGRGEKERTNGQNKTQRNSERRKQPIFKTKNSTTEPRKHACMYNTPKIVPEAFRRLHPSPPGRRSLSCPPRPSPPPERGPTGLAGRSSGSRRRTTAACRSPPGSSAASARKPCRGSASSPSLEGARRRRRRHRIAATGRERKRTKRRFARSSQQGGRIGVRVKKITYV